jgi:uncharacterized protein YnzC (UPF0291/DUF896 family)
MLEASKMERLNELAKKKKEGALTEAESVEQAALRAEYLQVFRGGFEETLLHTKVIDPEGNDVTPEKLKALQAEKVVH